MNTALYGKKRYFPAILILFLQKCLYNSNKSGIFATTVPATPLNNAYHGGYLSIGGGIGRRVSGRLPSEQR